MGVLIKQGVYDLWQRAPITEWQGAGDPRAKIRIADLLHMSSGLRIKAPQDPDYDPSGTYPDHLYLNTGSVDSFHYAATRPLQWPPNTVGRYRNTDPVLINYLIRLAVEKRGEEYLSFPRRALFDKIGIRTMVMETDPSAPLSITDRRGKGKASRRIHEPRGRPSDSICHSVSIRLFSRF